MVVKLLKELHDHENQFFPMVKCLSIFSTRLPGHLLGKRVSKNKVVLFTVYQNYYSIEGYSCILYAICKEKSEQIVGNLLMAM